MKPVDGAAVDERREHTQPVAERIAYRTHGENDVEVLLHSLDEIVVHRQRRSLDLPHLKFVADMIDLSFIAGGIHIRVEMCHNADTDRRHTRYWNLQWMQTEYVYSRFFC